MVKFITTCAGVSIVCAIILLSLTTVGMSIVIALLVAIPILIIGFCLGRKL